ncbi:hypothetical protein K502DRAFT_295387, partial [Neoconidiobolus thromboides FSU 785]
DDHLILILDKYTQSLPWESLPSLRERSVSRLPCLSFLRDSLLTLNKNDRGEVCIPVVNSKNGYYILDADRNLPKTYDRFSSELKCTGWEGTERKIPDKKYVANKLQEKDIYTYIGHGSSEHVFPTKNLRGIQNCAVALIFGCSSGVLKYEGECDLDGTVMQYLMAGSTGVLGNLWDVTDKDIDLFTAATFENWGVQPFHKGDSGAKCSLSMAISKAREVCRLKYLIGAAPILYGIPSNIR